jgi:ComF family protein
VAFRQAVAVFRYEGCVREAIHRWKYRGDLRAGASLCDMLLEALRQEEFMGSVQVVIPVPLHWVRRLRRRFNQSEFLARAVARRFGVGFAPGVLRRIRNTPSQVGLTPAERHQNVRDAFRVVRPWALRGRTVLLVDDVLTTCATAGECARTLRGAGAGCVYVAALAR